MNNFCLLFELETNIVKKSFNQIKIKDIVRHQSIWAQLVSKLLQIIICRQRGCETFITFHLDHGIDDCVCDPCKSMEKSKGRGSKQRHGA
ncbi:hypothetical protein K443DRAFT_94046 [Laccaria amethystina LaAM-08-1]|uniref:Uncharacterized protein n=1 Tax=Laccaria amethystina LaAM-08-1 TaxID=1095629 RepID=A0A0C9WWD5_9AGAR|nr:hypothetical protein K443DRAFT_94046 [Laccaria amethystina LaAM-08-1]